MKKLSNLLLAATMLLALAACGGTTTEPPTTGMPTVESTATGTPATEPPAAETPGADEEPAATPDPSAPVTQLFYSSDVAELEGAWTLSQVYTNGETFDAVADAVTFTITFTLDPSELVDQAAYIHNQVYNLTGDLTFGVAAINDTLSADGLDGYRGSTSWSDFPQGKVMEDGKFYQQPGPATMRFQDVDDYGLFLDQLAAGAPADVDTTDRKLILGINNQGQLLLGASEAHLERPGKEGDWTYCLIFDKAA